MLTNEVRLSFRGIKKEHCILAASTLATCLATLILSARRVALYDFNFIANAVHRISLGEIPYKDFDLVLPPLTFIPVYLIHHFLGLSIVKSMLISGLIIQVVALFAFYKILSRLRKNPQNYLSDFLFALAMSCAALVNVISVYPNYIYDSVATALTLVTIALLLNYLESDKYGYLILSHLFAYLTLLTKFNMGGSLILGIVLGRALTLVANRDTKKLIFEALSLISFSLLFLLLVSFFSLSHFIDQTVIAPKNFKEVMGFGQFTQYKYPLIFILLAVTLLGIKMISIQNLITKWTLYVLVIFLSFILFLHLFTPYSSGTIIGRVFPNANFAYPIIMVLSLNRLMHLQRSRSETVLLLMVIPIYFFGTFLSQGWNGSSYSLNPLLVILLITLYLTFDGIERRQLKTLLLTVVLLVSSNSLMAALSGSRLGYVAENGARGQSFNWSQVGIASNNNDIEQTAQVRDFLAVEKKTGTLVEFPAEDSLDQFSTKLTPWGRCLQFTYICPSRQSDQIVKDFGEKPADYVVVKTRTQIDWNLEPIVYKLEPILNECFTLSFKNENYQVYKAHGSTQSCVRKILKEKPRGFIN